MYINHAEFLLLTRTGRGPYCTRAGPQPFGLREPALVPERSGRLFRKRGRSGLLLRRGIGDGLRHGLGRATARRLGSPGRRSNADREYFELEFAVGFPAEDETLL